MTTLILTAALTACGKQTDKNDGKSATKAVGEEVTTEEATTPAPVVLNGIEYAFDVMDIDLSNQIIDFDELMAALGGLSDVQTVELYGCGYSMDELATLRSAYPDIDFGCMVNLNGMEFDSRSTEVDISGVAVSDADALSGSISVFSDSLTKIIMVDCGLTDEQMGALQDAHPDVKLAWNINLGGYWTIRTDAVAFSTLKDGTINYRLTNEDCQVLKYCTNMVALDLGHNYVTDISFLQYMPDLKILILVDDRNLQPDGTWNEEANGYITDLSYLAYCPKLMYLEFFVGSVSDISVLANLKNLVDLNISYNPISDITPLLNLPKLERLFLEHTNVTEEDYNLLCETYPDAQVVFYGEGSVDQGWREHDRYYAMIDMYHNNYVNELFED